jgi:hypothetical protein
MFIFSDRHDSVGPAFWGELFGHFLGVVVISGTYFLFRKWARRLTSGFLCVVSILIITQAWTFAIYHRAMAPIHLDHQTVENFAISAPAPFHGTTVPAQPDYVNYIHEYSSESKHITIIIEFFEFKYGPAYKDPEIMLAAFSNMAKGTFKQTIEKRPLGPFLINGNNGFREDFSATPSPKLPDVYVVKMTFPDPSKPEFKGINLTIFVEGMLEDKCNEEVGRIISSIEIHS